MLTNHLLALSIFGFHFLFGPTSVALIILFIVVILGVIYFKFQDLKEGFKKNPKRWILVIILLVIAFGAFSFTNKYIAPAADTLIQRKIDAFLNPPEPSPAEQAPVMTPQQPTSEVIPKEPANTKTLEAKNSAQTNTDKPKMVKSNPKPTKKSAQDWSVDAL